MNTADPRTVTAFDHFHAGRLPLAERQVRAILRDTPTDADAWLLLGLMADIAKHPADAEQYLKNAVQLAPTNYRAWNTLGTILESNGDLDAARTSFLNAIRIRTDYAPAHHNLGEIERALGRPAEAARRYREALASEPGLAAAASSLLFGLHFDPAVSAANIWAEHQAWGERLVESLPQSSPFTNSPEPDRPLILGYISPDFREHAVSRFFEPVLAAHDRQRHRIILYSECPIIDHVGTRLRELGDTWRVTRNLSAEQVADQVLADRVDILVDLAGHTRDNRLDVLARRPAPVQGTFLGYPFATGLPTIDFRVTDSILDPLDEAPRTGFGESPLRLPDGVCCFRPPDDAPPVAAPPVASRGFITFGSHHPLAKLSPELLQVWGRIARQLPTSRFLFARSNWGAAAERELRSRLALAEIPAERVEVRQVSATPGEYLSMYHDMDIILDANPFTGHTMTCEALWMGVPVLTLRGDRPAGRLSASVLTAMDLNKWIANTEDEYVRKALEFSSHPALLAQLRQELRERVRAHLGNALHWVRPLEHGYREAWRSWCRANRPSRKQSQPTEPRSWSPAPASMPTPVDWVKAHDEGCSRLAAGELDDAEACFRNAIVANPGAVPSRAMLAARLSDRCDLAGAAEQYQAALASSRDAKLKIAAATMLPPLYDSTEQIEEIRAQLIANLARLHADGVRLDPTAGPIPNLFLLAYQGHNDRELMRSFASLYSPPREFLEPPPLPPSPDGRIRVGILSEYFCNHTIGSLNRGLVEQLDRQRFHLTVISGTSTQDDTSAVYRQRADRFVSLPARTLEGVRLVRSLGLHLLLFTDLGMSVNTLALAHAKLAQRQAVLWGHPVTTGIQTIDDFISGDLYESLNADEHYTERLVRLSGLQTYYHRPQLERKYTRSDFSLPADGHLYGCPQTLFKFHPEFDTMLSRIFGEDPQGWLVLVKGRNRHWMERLLARWRRTAPRLVERTIWLPPLDRPAFVGLASVMDLALDTPHFGGGNTTLELLAVGTPVVTTPSPLLRSRLAAGMYRHIELPDLVSENQEDYIRDALRLAKDKAWNEFVRAKVSAKAERLFRDESSVRAMESYFTVIARQ